MSSTLESYELIRFAEAFEARLATAGEMLAGRPGLEAEKRWLADALELVRTTREPSAGVLDRVKDLPELEEAREEYAFVQLGLWVDALEKLHAGITFTASSRAPVIEALFPHLKFPQLRRAPREAILEYATSFERRTKSSYVTRIFARDDFALVRPVMEQVFTAHSEWRSSHEPSPLTPEVEAVLREELVALGRKLDVALRQARLLSEAALVPVPSVHEAAGLGLKPRRRAGRGLGPTADEGLAGFPDEPVDSMEPTEAELAEVAALDAGGAEVASPGPEHDDGAVPEEAPDGAEAPVAVGAADSAPADAAGEALPGDTSAPEEVQAAGGTSVEAPAPEPRSTGGRRGKAAPPSAADPTREKVASEEAAGESDEGVLSEAAASTAGTVHGEEPASSAEEAPAPARGTRKGRKKADAPAPEAAEASPAEAQAPRVRKKKAAAPDASGTDTP
jgi:hypothetical protein